MAKLIPIYFILHLFDLCFGPPRPEVQLICRLPEVVKESSGLAVFNENLFATHDDSGGEPVIYFFDASGTMVDTLRLPVTNVDWEALAVGEGKMYVGDFGNNLKERNDLKIYAFDIVETRRTGPVSSISIAYPNGNFDAEGLFYANDSLYILTKEPKVVKGKAQVYSVPTEGPGGILVYRGKLEFKGPVTGADYLDDKVALIGYGYLHVMHPFLSAGNLNTDFHSYTIPFSQTEAVGWLDAKTVYYTNEGGALYRMVLPDRK